jgi:mRNA (guanine-N7-)-methyltransferase
MDQALVAEHYNKRREEGKEGRQTSRIIRLRNLNNWVKAVLIGLHSKPGWAVLDLACGKGGDLLKYMRAETSFWVGVDHARVSLEHAVQRYNELLPGQPPFPAHFFCGDVFGIDLVSHLDAQWPDFDLVSCQFAIHYAFENEQRVRQLLENVTCRLRPGGFFIGTTPDANVLVSKLRAAPEMSFGNNIYRVVFDRPQAGEPGNVSALEHAADPDESQLTAVLPSGKRFAPTQPFGIRYRFTLDENVEDCPEYLVHFPTFERIAKEYGLALLLHMNFHAFVDAFALQAEAPARYRELFQRMKVLDPEGGTISPEEWDAAYLYMVFAFRKLGEPRNDFERTEKHIRPAPAEPLDPKTAIRDLSV